MLWKYFCVCDIICSLAKTAYFVKNTNTQSKEANTPLHNVEKSCATGKKGAYERQNLKNTGNICSYRLDFDVFLSFCVQQIRPKSR